MTRIPTELTERPQWVVWKYETRGGKRTKVLYQLNGQKAKSNNPATWTDYLSACAAAASWNGIGFVFSEDDPFCGIDLDKCLDAEGQIKPWAKTYLDRLNSYSEISPSGTGIKIWVRGAMPEGKGRKKVDAGPDGGAVEMYDRRRYFTVTGRHFAGTPLTVEDRQFAIDAIWAELFAPPPKVATVASGTGAMEASDGELIELAMTASNGDRFKQLWNGSLDGNGGDHSSADLALCNLLAFWCGPDAARIERLFQMSGLFRGKWEGRQWYRDKTIAMALDGRTDFYRPTGDDDADCEPYVAFYYKGVIEQKPDKPEAPAVLPTQTIVVPHNPAPAAQAEENPDRPIIANVHDKPIKSKKGEAFIKLHITQPAIVKAINEAMGEWPRRAGGLLFAYKGGPEAIPTTNHVRMIDNQDDLFAWLETKCDVRWTGGDVIHHKSGRPLSPPTRGQVYEHLKSSAEPSYRGLEFLPHEPVINGIFYVPCRLPPVGPGKGALGILLDRLNPETELDRGLLLAAMLTPGWGGPAGARPAFVFSSDHGRGAGKTATAEVLAGIWGGVVGVGGGEEFDQVKKRLLGDDALSKRICLIDNIKGKLSGSDLESAITAESIDGWRPYHGQASRPNLLTWFLTSNSPSLSRDLADRSVIIKIGVQQHESDFVSWARAFVAEHRAEIIAQCLAILRGPKGNIDRENRDRWHAWQEGVLSRLAGANELAVLIKARRPDADGDNDEAEEIKRVMMELVTDHYPEHDELNIFITRRQLHLRLQVAGVIDRSFGPKQCTTWVRERCGTGPLAQLKEYRQEADRGWLFIGKKSYLNAKVNRINKEPNSYDELMKWLNATR